MSNRLLFVDDDRSGLELSRFNLEAAGYEVDVAENGTQAIARFSADLHDLVVTDLRMPGQTGMDVLAHIRKTAADVPVLVITAHGNVDTAVRAMRSGAYDFIEKPFARDVLLLAVDRALEHRRLAVENRSLRLKVSGVEREIVAVSPAMTELILTADRLAASEASVLILGESGTGKELIARRIHARSSRAEGPFVAVNCAAMPSELLESELFGHEKGAFTGATKARSGRFRKATGGTIFLDEIGELPMALQAKLLRVLQEKTVDVLGNDQPVDVDVRVLAATNQDLAQRIEAGQFREDFYYRLAVVEIKVPALRDRLEDIQVLARHFVSSATSDDELTIPSELLTLLRKHPWPGNVRELENTCERLAILSRGGLLSVGDLPAGFGQGRAEAASEEWPPLPDEGISLVDLERRVIERALALKGGNVSQAAAFLRVPRHILAYRIEKYGLKRG
jgi:DNA-binding NtrC family response regulator